MDNVIFLKRHLQSPFQMKDMEYMKDFLGIEVAYSKRGYILSKHKYTMEIIGKAPLTDYNIVETPLERNVKLSPSEGDPVADPSKYRQLVGSLIYVASTRPEIAFSVHVVSQFMSDPRRPHFTAVLRIIRYLRTYSGRGLLGPARSSPREL